MAGRVIYLVIYENKFSFPPYCFCVACLFEFPVLGLQSKVLDQERMVPVLVQEKMVPVLVQEKMLPVLV